MLTYFEDEISLDPIDRDRCLYADCILNISSYGFVPGKAIT